jgi:hypothetical protein
MRRLLFASLVLIGCGCIAEEPIAIDAVDAPDAGARAPSLGSHVAALSLAARLAPAEHAWLLAPTREGLRREASSLGVGAITSPAERARVGAFDGVGARLPEAADGAFAIGLSRVPRFRASLRFEGAAAAQAEIDEGRVVYPDAWTDTDLLVVAGHARLESLFLVRSAAAPTTWSVSLALPSGVVDVREERVTESTSRLTLLDRAGKPVLYLPQPWAADAHGDRRPVSVSFARPSPSRLALTYRLDARALAYPVLVDPAIESSAWTAIPSGATTASIGHSMAYDPDRKVVVLYSGSSVACGSCAETWEYAAGAWASKCTSCAPGVRYDHAMAYDSVNKRMILALGAGHTDLWAWKSGAWTKLSVTADVARSRFAFGIAPGTTVAALFGGVTTTSYPNASIDLATGWKGSIPFSLPSTPRAGSPIVWDPKHGAFLLFSGSTGTADTWSLPTAGGNWDVHSPSTSPAARVDHGLAYDSIRGRAVLFGGVVDKKTWEYDGSNWIDMTPSTSPSARKQGTLAFMADRKRVLLYGGADVGGSFLTDTWEYHARGGACTADTECDTGHCVDGVCCETASCGTCEACDTATLPGVCSKVLSADDDTCNGAKTCDAAGACKLKVAQGCAADGDCALGHCVDAICCQTACVSPMTCGAGGVCVPNTASCDGDHTTTDARGNKTDCSPYKCESSGDCRHACTVTDDCVSGKVCDGAQCVTPQAESSDSGGCAIDPRSGHGGALAGFAIALTAIGLARRRARAAERG